ncbi:MAG TPA: GMC family oxidoreductase N-terminal domain-containing protein, partial [Acidimicrobiia bacterium]|nr:GMC family oxidoreductase N-terminal domain-containing protein [Acidimicrobiia bacterium]
YDDIIVGGGSAGGVLATRLSQDEGRRVLLIEAGPDPGVVTDADRLGDQMRFASTLTAWGIDASFVPGVDLNYPQGRTMGGGSAVNGAFAVRGLPDDYARWAAAAGDEWSWPHMLRVLRRLESDQDFDGDAHGTAGPVPVVRWRRDELLPVQEAFLTAVTDHGIPWVDDLNAPGASGIGAIPMNRRDGVRVSTALSYLPLARSRPNLTIWPDTEVTRVRLEQGRAVGVEYPRDGRLHDVRGARVVVCAGALQSPALLMRSGIGPARHLAELGIECTVDLPGVGENLVDHEGIAVFLVPEGELPPPDERVCQLGARSSSSLGTGADDMWLSCWSAWELAGFPDMHAALGVPSISALVVGVHDPRSHGTVRLRSADPAVRPAVDFRMLTDPADLPRLVEGLQLVLELASHRAFTASYRGIGLLDPASADDREALETYIRTTVGGWYHASGTCRMGTDPAGGAVVDGRLRVFGVDALHVADASVMPTIPRAPTNLSSIAIGERAAELLSS